MSRLNSFVKIFGASGKLSIRYFLVLSILLPLIVSLMGYVVSAQQADRPWHVVRSVYTGEYGIANPGGLAFSPAADAFLVWSEDGSVSGLGMHEAAVDTRGLRIPAADGRNIAFNGKTSSLFALQTVQLDEFRADAKGMPASGNRPSRTHSLDGVNVAGARGITFDPASGRMFVLNADGNELFSIAPDTSSRFDGRAAVVDGRVVRISLSDLGAERLQGIAFNASNGYLYMSDPVHRRLYEVTQAGKKVSEYDLSSLALVNPEALVFAPSVDRTDDPARMNLFLLDSGQSTSSSGQIIELSLEAPASLPSGTTLLPATLLQIADTSNAAWDPSSPDPAGITYLPLTGRLLVVDSEVEEMQPYWAGANVFDATTSGTLVSTCTTFTTSALTGAWNNYSKEPTGVSVNPNNNFIYIADDAGGGKLHEVDPGPDGTYCTSDDVVTTIKFETDLEDVAYGNNMLFIAGGSDAEVWMWDLGPNGVLGGGDDGLVTSFDTASLGFSDLEGIAYNWDAGTLFIISARKSEAYLGEVTTSGTLLRAYDLSFMGSASGLRSGVTYAPGSQNPNVRNIYIVSRGVDNGANPNENDGKWWEVNIGNQPTSTPSATSTRTPTSTPTQTGTATATQPAGIQVLIGGGKPANHTVTSGQTIRVSYPKLNKGPVQLINTSANSLLGSEAVRYSINGTHISFSEMMGLPANQVDNVYWLPWYNSKTLDTQLRIANVSSQAATVHVRIGGVEVTGSPFTLTAGQSLRKTFPNIDKGPVQIESNRNIVAAERVIHRVNGNPVSFSEMMALPASQLDNVYWLPWYNSKTLNTQLRVANVSSQTATVHVRIGGVEVTGSPFTLTAGQSLRKTFPNIDKGPVQIESNRNIVAAERVIYKVNGVDTSFSEMMALPASQLDNVYWLPWYNNGGSTDTQLRFANVSGTTATVRVFIGGVEVMGSPFTLTAGQSLRRSFPITNKGPVEIRSTQNIVAAERLIYKAAGGVHTSFSEMMGLPASQLHTTYWLPWYNNLELNTELRLGVP